MSFLEGYREYILGWLPQMGLAALVTLELTALSFLVAVGIGLVVPGLRTARSRLLNGIAAVYVEFFRG
ncbi:MAG: hypothetical protein IRY94_18315, partial [Rhodospirillaceae bacterium]|nr:hypothetical protein [Rhodospirillaceae bacterium]